jgi:hypothetical protein
VLGPASFRAVAMMICVGFGAHHAARARGPARGVWRGANHVAVLDSRADLRQVVVAGRRAHLTIAENVILRRAALFHLENP